MARRGSPVACTKLKPKLVTSDGRSACAWAALFCVFTWSMSIALSTSKVTCRVKVPSFAFVDRM
jgi:hypothetical protein